MKRFSLLLFSLIILSCNKNDSYELKGKVVYNQKPLFDAEIQVFLKQEKEKETPPIKVVASDEKGEFSITLPKGRYYLVARKKYEEQGEVDMLFGNYPDNPVILEKNTVLKEWQLQSKKEKLTYSKLSGIKGNVAGFNNYRNVRVYVYKTDDTGLKGPDYITKAKIDQKGFFTIDLPEGDYFIVVRERKNSTSGLLKEGDLTGEYKQNPVNVKNNNYIDIGKIDIKLVDKNKVNEINEKGVIKKGVAELSGTVIDQKGSPVKNVYVLLYDNPEMVGRPVMISTPTKVDGKFTVSIINPGKYYVGARSKIGGPAEPGELIGTYIGSADKSIKIDKDSKIKIKIEVHEVW